MSIPGKGCTSQRQTYTSQMETASGVSSTPPIASAPTRQRIIFSAARYLAGKALTILLTIFVTIFVTLLIVNYPAGPALGISPFEQNLEAQIYSAAGEANFLTGLAFAMLGSALERILNPRVIDDGPGTSVSNAKTGERRSLLPFVNRRTAAGLAVILLAFVIVRSSAKIKSFVDSITDGLSPVPAAASGKPTINPEQIQDAPTVTPASTSTDVPVIVSPTLSTPTALSPTLAETPSPTFSATLEPTTSATDMASIPVTYILHSGEYPYCIARRFDVDPTELLQANGLTDNENFYTGMVLSIPESGRRFPGLAN